MWHQTLYELPPEGVAVYTKIDDKRGCRNEGKLYRRGNLWFLPFIIRQLIGNISYRMKQRFNRRFKRE